MFFVFLHKKIAIPQQTELLCVSWNQDAGYIACGGKHALLKVLQLQDDKGGASSSAGGAPAGASTGTLAMNQTLEGHQDEVRVLTWNENHRKLTTSDSSGLIIVWMLHKGQWFEEMINNRNKSVVKDMKWTADGEKICIIYEDGAVIVGTVSGQRLWGKELKIQLRLVEWSPDGKNILFGCGAAGEHEVHVYDKEGTFSHRIDIVDQVRGSNANLIGIQWCAHGWNSSAPPLAVAFDNGKLQVMNHDNDSKVVLIDMKSDQVDSVTCKGIKWSPNGTVLAVYGSEQRTNIDGQTNTIQVVQFYDAFGKHLYTLKVPGGQQAMLQSLSWRGDGSRLALAVGPHLFFAQVRNPVHYMWAYFSNTVVTAQIARNKNEHTHSIIFWQTQPSEQAKGAEDSSRKALKYISNVTHIACADKYCVIVKSGDTSSAGGAAKQGVYVSGL